MTYIALIFLITGILGICLIAIISALIFNPSFRNDVLNVEGKASVLKYFTVEGATDAIVILTKSNLLSVRI